MDELLNVAQAAEELGLSPVMMRRYCKEGRIDAKKVGALWVITREALEAFKKTPRPVGRPKEEQEDEPDA